MCSAPLPSSINPLQGSWQGAAGPRLTAQLSSARPLASIVLSLGPWPKPAEIPEGKYLGNGLQTTIAFKSQSKPSTGETASPGNILCTKHGQLLAGYFMTRRARSDEKVQSAPVLGGPWGHSLPVVFGLLGKLVVPKNQTLVIRARVLLTARITKGAHGCLSRRRAWSSHSWSTAISAEKSSLWLCGLFFGQGGSIAEGKEQKHPILACNTKGWLLGNGFSLSYSHPWTVSGASIKAALPLHAAGPPVTPAPPGPVSGTAMLLSSMWGGMMSQGHRTGAEPGGC